MTVYFRGLEIPSQTTDIVDWEGTIDRDTAIWLRFYDADGNLVPLPEEAAQARAERLAARLRKLGEDPDTSMKS